MKISPRLLAQRHFVKRTFGNAIICSRCGSTLGDYADACSADLADPCPGFMAIEKVRAEFDAEWNAGKIDHEPR